MGEAPLSLHGCALLLLLLFCWGGWESDVLVLMNTVCFLCLLGFKCHCGPDKNLSVIVQDISGTNSSP